MSRNPRIDVAVVGGGVVGAAAALVACQRGLQVALIEARPTPAWSIEQPDLRVYALAADNRALFERLQVWPSIVAARAPAYRHMRVWDAAGGGELHLSADELGQPELGHIVENDLLVDRLWAALRQRAELQLHCPAQIEQLDDEADGLRLQLSDGSRLRARLLLAADGAMSPLRERLGIASDRHDYRQRGLVAYVRCDQDPAETAWQRFLPTGPLAFLPCGGGQSSIVWTLPEVEAARLCAADESVFRRELGRAFDARLGEVIEVGKRVVFPLRRQLAQEFLRGRVLLLGDAAHAVHPLAGQGVNLGLRDVAAFDAVLASAQARGLALDAPHRWQRWARERRSATSLAAYGFEAINRVFSNDAMLPTLLRGPLLGLAGRLPGFGGAMWAVAAGRQSGASP